MPIPAIGYARVSTNMQTQEGLSMLAQTERMTAYALLRDLQLVEIIEEPRISGGVPLAERKGGERLVARVTAGDVKAVVACKLDRLFRDVADMLTISRTWNDLGCTLHLIDFGGGQAVDTSSAQGRFFLTTIAAVAEWERAITSERIRILRDAGYRMGGSVPYGKMVTEDGKHLVDCPEEQAVIRAVLRYRYKRETWDEICNKLMRRGMKARSGKKFVEPQVRRMVAMWMRDHGVEET